VGATLEIRDLPTRWEESLPRKYNLFYKALFATSVTSNIFVATLYVLLNCLCIFVSSFVGKSAEFWSLSYIIFKLIKGVSLYLFILSYNEAINLSAYITHITYITYVSHFKHQEASRTVKIHVSLFQFISCHIVQ
jgi:hypothetical protein